MTSIEYDDSIRNTIPPKGFRGFIEELSKSSGVKWVEKDVSSSYEAASVLAAYDGTPVVFKSVDGIQTRVAGNVYSSRELLAKYFHIDGRQVTDLMRRSISNPKPVSLDSIKRQAAPCNEVSEAEVNIPKQLPVLRHTRGDGGRYVTSAVFCASDPEYGLNLSVHRLMVKEQAPRKLGMRIVPRDLLTYLERAGGEIDVVATIGNGLGYLLAAAVTVPKGYDELGIANALEQQEMVLASTVDLPVPSDSEYVLEGRIYTEPPEKEGPFFDLTLTLDAVREQPVFEVRKVTHRRDPIYHALLPGYGEHRTLMGVPREPTIFMEVSKVTRCTGVRLTDGGGGWLHAVVAIHKENQDDGVKAIEAAFRGHPSLKHVIVVDDDIDPADMGEVEWALATRFQAGRGLIVYRDVVGSSLDPSADRATRKTSKMGLDATIPLDRRREDFVKWGFDPVDPSLY
ncbi:MAG: UbiD family decarboxylase [Thermoprotei archaeon]